MKRRLYQRKSIAIEVRWKEDDCKEFIVVQNKKEKLYIKIVKTTSVFPVVLWYSTAIFIEIKKTAIFRCGTPQ